MAPTLGAEGYGARLTHGVVGHDGRRGLVLERSTVAKLPGLMIVTLTPSGATAPANACYRPST